eukprot:Platyproteum_vivax@DN5182_c0_g1_i1.p1
MNLETLSAELRALESQSIQYNVDDLIEKFKLVEHELERKAKIAPQDIAYYYAMFLLLLLCKPDLLPAKFLWKRISAYHALRNTPTLRNIHEVIIPLWKQNYPRFFTVAQELEWPADLKKMVLHLVGTKRAWLVAGIARSYSSIQTAKACKVLGLSSNDAVELVRVYGWSVDGDYLLPIHLPSEPITEDPAQHAKDLIRQVAALEQFARKKQ